MPSERKNILDKQTREKIYSLSESSLLAAQQYLAVFHASTQYKQLVQTKRSNLCDEDIICLALTRKPSDLNKIDFIKLKNAIFNIYLDNEPLDYKDFINDDFYNLCMKIAELKRHDILMKGLKAATFVLIAMNYSTTVFPYSSPQSHDDCTRDFFIRFRGTLDNRLMKYSNLSGLDLQKLNLKFVNLSDTDLTDVNLSYAKLINASLDRVLLTNVYFYQAEIRNLSLKSVSFNPDQFKNVELDYYSIRFLTSQFDINSLVEQLDFLASQGLDPQKHEIIFKSLVIEIENSLKQMDIPIDQKEILLKIAISHPLFGDKKANTITNWFNSAVSFVSIGENKDEPTIAISAPQRNLYTIQFMLKKYPQFFRPAPNLSGFDNRANLTGNVEAFIKKHGSCYEALEVDRDANTDEIKRKFKVLSLQYHPDKNPSSEAAAHFLKIKEAKEILTENSKRRIHDQLIPQEVTRGRRPAGGVG